MVHHQMRGRSNFIIRHALVVLIAEREVSQHFPSEPPSYRENDHGAEDEEQGHEFEDEAGVDGEGVEVDGGEQGGNEGARN